MKCRKNSNEKWTLKSTVEKEKKEDTRKNDDVDENEWREAMRVNHRYHCRKKVKNNGMMEKNYDI